MIYDLYIIDTIRVFAVNINGVWWLCVQWNEITNNSNTTSGIRPNRLILSYFTVVRILLLIYYYHHGQAPYLLWYSIIFIIYYYTNGVLRIQYNTIILYDLYKHSEIYAVAYSRYSYLYAPYIYIYYLYIGTIVVIIIRLQLLIQY